MKSDQPLRQPVSNIITYMAESGGLSWLRSRLFCKWDAVFIAETIGDIFCERESALWIRRNEVHTQ